MLAAADVDADRRIKLQRPPAGRRFRVAEHHADLLADLVDEDHRGAALGDRRRQLPHRLAHQPGLQTHVAVAHLPFDFRAGNQGRHRVDHDHVHGVGAHQQLADLQRLLARIRLARPADHQA